MSKVWDNPRCLRTQSVEEGHVCLMNRRWLEELRAGDIFSGLYLLVCRSGPLMMDEVCAFVSDINIQ
jgi:hypothetical protein